MLSTHPAVTAPTLERSTPSADRISAKSLGLL